MEESMRNRRNAINASNPRRSLQNQSKDRYLWRMPSIHER